MYEFLCNFKSVTNDSNPDVPRLEIELFYKVFSFNSVRCREMSRSAQRFCVQSLTILIHFVSLLIGQDNQEISLPTLLKKRRAAFSSRLN